MTGDISVSAGGDIKGNAFAIGHCSLATLATARADPAKDLAALRTIIAKLGEIDPEALSRLDEASAELKKEPPDRSRFGALVVQGTHYARLANGFAEQYEHLVPHLKSLAAWLGQSWSEFQVTLGL